MLYFFARLPVNLSSDSSLAWRTVARLLLSQGQERSLGEGGDGWVWGGGIAVPMLI